MNIFVITADDVSGYSMGYANPDQLDFTPNLNELSKKSATFLRAYTNITFCEPARGVLNSGLYPQNNGSTWKKSQFKGILTLPYLLKQNGFRTCIINKIRHHLPHGNYNWDIKITLGESDFLKKMKEQLEQQQSQPLFFLCNLNLVHRPFPHKRVPKVTLPAFLADIKTPEIVDEYKRYCAGLQELDQQIAKLLELIDLSKDLLIFTSDHGMSFPFAKGNCYSLSSNIPLIWSGPGILPSMQNDSLVSSVDLFPTILQYLNYDPVHTDGNSYAIALKGEKCVGFEYVYVQLNKMLTGDSALIRSLISKDYCYVMNYDQNFPYRSVDDMERILHGFDKSLLKRRPKEELYLNDNRIMNANLVKTHIEVRAKMSKKLRDFMVKYKDPFIANFV